MSYQSANRAQSERAGIWTVAVLIVIGAVWAVIKFVPSAPPAPLNDVGVITAQDHTQGTGQVSLIEYSDFQCPACKTYYPIIKQLVKDYGDRVTFVYRHFPLKQIHQNAEMAARAAEAAGQQGKFWEMHDKIFEGQESWAEERNPKIVFEAYAKDLGLNVEQFNRDIESDEVKDRVNADLTGGNAANVNATPTFYLNGQYLPTPSDYDGFKAALERALQS